MATIMKTKRNAIWTNHKSVLLLNKWLKTITKTMTTAMKFIKFSRLIVYFHYNFSFINSAQFGNGPNCSQVKRLVYTIRFLIRFKEVTDAKQYFYELKQCQLKNGSCQTSLNGETAVIKCCMILVLVSVTVRKKHFNHQVIDEKSSARLPSTSAT